VKPLKLRVAVLLTAGPMLAACGSSSSTPAPALTPTPSATASPTPSPTLTGPDAACQAALQKQFDTDTAEADNGQTPPPPVQPKACKGIDKAKVKSWTDAMAQAWIQQHLTTTTN